MYRPGYHQSLHPDGKEIRVVQLIPAPAGEKFGKFLMRCHTEVIKFDEEGVSPVPYSALSYTWGDPQKKAAILLDDQVIEVTENLAIALQHLERSHSMKKIWIDAICIDQTNEVEKSQQVEIMGTIFKRAVEVIVWIGPSEQGSTEALRVLKQIGQEMIQSGTNRSLSWREEAEAEAEAEAEYDGENGDDEQEGAGGPTGSPSRDEENSVLRAIGCKWFPRGEPIFDPIPITRIFQRPWFRRVWVLQEATVNECVTFHCGEDTVAKTTLWAGARAVIALTNGLFVQTGHQLVEEPIWQTLSGANFISRRTMDLVTGSQGDHTLERLLLETATNLGHWAYEASDPRDRIFAILGLSSDLSVLGIRSDYEKPCSNVYTATAEAILTKSNTIDILYGVTWPKHVQAMPSWVPDWSTTIPASFGPRHLRRFSASGKLSSATPVFSSDQFGNRLLALQGYEVDTVNTIWDWRYDSFTRDDDRICDAAPFRFVELFREFAQSNSAVYPSIELKNEALWRTPIADCDAVFNLKQRHRPAATVRMKQSFDALMTANSGGALCEAAARAYLHVTKLVSARRRLFVSCQGYLGLGQETLRAGDTICVLFGGDSPLLIRDAGLGYYRLVGEAYVHGIMHGESLDLNLPSKRFKLC